MASVAAQVARLQKMTVAELRIEWEKVFGEPTKQRHRVHLWKRLARAIQGNTGPQLSDDEEVQVQAYRKVIRELPPEKWFPGAKQNRQSRSTSPRVRSTPAVGSVITRQYRGREMAVLVRDDGFEFEGQVYRSLSAIAKVVTGTTWNGPAWFGLRKGPQR